MDLTKQRYLADINKMNRYANVSDATFGLALLSNILAGVFHLIQSDVPTIIAILTTCLALVISGYCGASATKVSSTIQRPGR